MSLVLKSPTYMDSIFLRALSSISPTRISTPSFIFEDREANSASALSATPMSRLDADLYGE